ncbi:glycosyltransferase family 2 protein [Thalassospira marina]|uniref:Dolichol-phosphate mannosyltransferase n=1 Tax=Thalassospira marina TaxID=2048283 RepID=A0ABM6QG16_9PROT|nr:glycosyltransferase family 2 protein [Thalassospira marina]AUG55544.1 dolichol-phosphate mannosyltransferase [Thalassospira marina]
MTIEKNALPEQSNPATGAGDDAAKQVFDAGAPELSVVVPVKNEVENIEPLVTEIVAALRGKVPFEIIYVDDGSTDETTTIVRDLRQRIEELHLICHEKSCGQSIAVLTGVKNARGKLIVTLDGDGQNDPADIPQMLERYRAEGADAQVLIAGWRANRHDTAMKRIQSRIANKVRGGLLKDQTPDTGCGIKLFRREDFLAFPRFNHMHRFLPALMLRDGGRVFSVAVNHRPRLRGQSNYSMMNRLWVGIVDIMGVMWLQARAKTPVVKSKE